MKPKNRLINFINIAIDKIAEAIKLVFGLFVILCPIYILIMLAIWLTKKAIG